MNVYAIWVDLVNGSEDIAFAKALQAYLGDLQSKGLLESFSLERRKFGFGPESLGEFHVRILCKDLAQLDAAFHVVATREDPIESLHSQVFRRVKNFRSGLYRTFPDEVRNVD